MRGPFALGLRFDADTTTALVRDEDACRAFAGELADLDLVPVTANAFVAGVFHGSPLKEKVYAPTWEDPARVRYTLETAQVLLRLSSGETRPTISTAPGSWRAWVQGRAPEADAACAANLAETARGLRDLAQQTGRHVALGLEPEPGCTIQTVDDAVRFFTGPLADALAGDADARSHLGICYDVCHQAVMHEDVAEGLARLAAAGIDVVKLQASVALEAPDPSDGAQRDALAAFDEAVYLHQVATRDARGMLHLVPDLPDALGAGGGPWAGRSPWRVHFHVPVYRDALVGGLRTTRPALDAALGALVRAGRVPPIEVETYTWDVLPAAERREGLVAALARELAYVRARLEEETVTR